MLPSSHRGYGGGSFSKKRTADWSLIASVILLFCLLFSSWGWHSSSRQSVQWKAKATQAQEENEKLANQNRGEYQSLERQYSGMQRQIMEYSRQLQSKEQELLQALADKATAQAEHHKKENELNDVLAFEREIHTALEAHVTELQAGYNSREKDWHELAETWQKFEEDSLKENHRLLSENKKLQNLAEPTTFNDPAMPSQEPRVKQGSHIPGKEDSFHIPEYQRGKYYKDWEKETLKQQSEVEEAKRRVLEAEQKLKEAKEKQGEVSSHATSAGGVGGEGGQEGEAKAPDSRPSAARYHHDVYSEHHPPSHHEPHHEPHHEAARHEPHHEEHLDPLDASFMHGEFDNFHDHHYDHHYNHLYEHHDSWDHDSHDAWDHGHHDSWDHGDDSHWQAAPQHQGQHQGTGDHHVPQVQGQGHQQQHQGGWQAPQGEHHPAQGQGHQQQQQQGEGGSGMGGRHDIPRERRW